MDALQQEDDLHLTDIDLIRKLIGHLEANHYMETKMVKLSQLLQNIIGEKVIVKKFEPCKRPIAPGHVYFIHGERVPAPRCNF